MNWKQLCEDAEKSGLYVTTYSPGDGRTRYKLVIKPVDYFAASGYDVVYSCTGRKEAAAFIEGWLTGKEVRK